MKPPITRRVAKIAAAVLVAAAAVLTWAAAFVYSGLYDISATDEHTPPVYWLMEFTMRRSVKALWHDLRLLIGRHRRRFDVRFVFVFPRIGCRRVHLILSLFRPSHILL